MMYYTAKNTQYNRLSDILDKEIILLEKKNGFAYFMIQYASHNVFLQSNANLFDKQFDCLADKLVNEAILALYKTLKPVDFKQYPKDLIKAIE